MAKTAYPVSLFPGESRRVPVPAIGGGMGWTRVAVTFASAGVTVVNAIVGPTPRPIPGLAPTPPETKVEFSSRGYVDLVQGDEWLMVVLDPYETGTLDLLVEATDE